MSINVNRVTLAGNLTRSPELRFTASNTAVCKIGLATNRKWTDRNTNEKKEDVTFVDCTAFGKQAEVINQYMDKGRPIYIEGRLNLNAWTTTEGEKRQKLEVIIEQFQFLGGPKDDDQGGNQRPAQGQRQQPPANQGGHEALDDSSIPF